jgi:hypothetical protein
MAAQRQEELIGEGAAIEAQLTELRHRKFTLEMERPIMIDHTKAQARARVVATTINRERAPRPIFARASQRVATVAALLDTLPAPSTDRAKKVCW